MSKGIFSALDASQSLSTNTFRQLEAQFVV